MIEERKAFFIDELKAHYREIISGAHRAEVDAAGAAEHIRREARKKEDAKSASEFVRSASSHRRRRERARRELEMLVAFASGGIRAIPPTGQVGLGALVDVSIEGEEGSEERTLFVLPVGAGTELNGPGGDGFVSVITPASPLGRALQGARAGDCVEVSIEGRDRDWTIVDLC